MPDKRSYSYILVYIQIMCYHICKDKGFFFTGIVSVQDRRTAYEAKIFLNTRGKHPELVLPELIELLKYMEHSTDEVSEQCKSERIQKMHRRVCRIKASEKTEVKYMQAWEEKLLERQKEKRELLRKMNHKMSIEEIADVLDMDVSKVKDIIEEQYDTED